MLENILVPLDGSTRAEAILTELRVLLARHDSEVVLLRVVLPPTTMNPPEYARLLDERRAEARAYIQRVVGELASAGATARGVVYEGYPAEAILAGAREQAATLIALTTHGRTGLARWDLGSVTEKVLRGGECPILVTRSFETAEAGATRERRPAQAAMRRILLPIDAGDLSPVAVGPAIELASLFEAELLLVHVLDEGLAGDNVGCLLRGVDKSKLGVALKGASATLRDLFFSNMSERGGKLLRDDMAGMGPVRLKDVDAAQQRMVQQAKDLAARGEIVLSDGKSEDELIY